jgi:hypothetical protein
MRETLLDFMMESAGKKFVELFEDEEDGLPERLLPLAVLRRVKDTLNSEKEDISPETIADMVQDIEDCLYLHENGLVEEEWAHHSSPPVPAPKEEPLPAVFDDEPDIPF